MLEAVGQFLISTGGPGTQLGEEAEWSREDWSVVAEGLDITLAILQQGQGYYENNYQEMHCPRR